MVKRHKRPKKIRNITQQLLILVETRDSIKSTLANVQMSEEAKQELRMYHDSYQKEIDRLMKKLDEVVKRGGITYEDNQERD